MAFKKGAIPWNKGIKNSTGISTARFQKGMIPWNAGTVIARFCIDCTGKVFNWNTRDKAKRCRTCYLKSWKLKENHPRWKDDRETIVGRHNRSLHDPSYKQWRHTVKIRDNFKCKILNSECKGRLEVHHILGWKDHPELRYEVNNGITLCHFHHPRKRKDEMKLSPYFQELVKV